MKGQKRIRDYGVQIGKLPTGARNAITDVAGVKVGHVTLSDGAVQTGVTAVLPHGGNLFRDKVMASSHVINGFGKTVGTIQIEELGTIETPIVLTNTLSVGTAMDALVEYMLERNEDIGRTTGTVNAVVCECNDGYLNDIRGRHVRKEHVLQALEQADEEFHEGAVGAGTGMSCYGLKGGVGTASRLVSYDGQEYAVGVLVLSNFGLLDDLRIDGSPVGRRIAERMRAEEDGREKGSIIFLVATDLPLSERQLKRLAKHTEVGLVRTGSHVGNGSGDIALAFTTANRIPHDAAEAFTALRMLDDNRIDQAFRAVAEATEEAILNSLICAETTEGRDGHRRESLQSFIMRQGVHS